MPEGVVNGPGEGEALRNAQAGRVAIVKCALPHMSVFEFTIEGPFDGPAPHMHADVDGKTIRGVPGTLVSAPPGVMHGFKKHDPGTARFLNIHAPGGFEHDLRAMSD